MQGWENTIQTLATPMKKFLVPWVLVPASMSGTTLKRISITFGPSVGMSPVCWDRSSGIRGWSCHKQLWRGRANEVFEGLNWRSFLSAGSIQTPEDARVPRDAHYDCAHGHESGRSIETLRLNSFITRL